MQSHNDWNFQFYKNLVIVYKRTPSVVSNILVHPVLFNPAWVVCLTVSDATITTDVWDTIFGILNIDSAIITTLGASIYGAYPQKFLDAGEGLPIIIIHKPRVIEEVTTMGTASYKLFPITIDIDCVAGSAANVKQLDDAVRNSLQTAVATTQAVKLKNFKVIADEEDFDLRNNKRIHFANMTVQYERG